MEKAEIQKQIDDAVRIFKEVLEKTYRDQDIPFYGINYQSLSNFFTGKISLARTKSGTLKITGEIPKEAFKDECTGLPRSISDYKIYPIVIGLFQVPDEELKKK